MDVLCYDGLVSAPLRYFCAAKYMILMLYDSKTPAQLLLDFESLAMYQTDDAHCIAVNVDGERANSYSCVTYLSGQQDYIKDVWGAYVLPMYYVIDPDDEQVISESPDLYELS